MRIAVDEPGAKLDPEVLFREAHHRMANNFQLITSLTGMQLRSGVTEEARSKLRWILEAVRTLERVQRSMVRAEHAGFGTHLREVAVLWEHLGAPRQISVRLSCDDTLAVPRASVQTLAIIVNELVMNALEHAFPDGRNGRIMIRLERDGDTSACLTVGDDGVGFDVKDATKSSAVNGSRLGLSLVQSLAIGLAADVRILSKEPSGTEIRVHLPL